MAGGFIFTSDWFSGHIAVWSACLAGLAGQPGLAFLEIGVFEGRSTVWLLQNVLTHPTARIDCVDPFTDEYIPPGVADPGMNPEQRFDYNIRFAHGEDRVIKRKGYSQQVLRGLPLDHYDFVYIDGSHAAADVLEDAVLSFRLLKSGGLLIFDDYEWNKAAPHIDHPEIGIDAFLDAYEGKYALLHKEYQVILRKEARARPPAGRRPGWRSALTRHWGAGRRPRR